MEKPNITNQLIFDIVVTHLRAQGRKSAKICREGTNEESVMCLYRYEEEGRTLKCAAGVLIPDALYDRKIEGLGINTDGGEVGLLFAKLGYTTEQIRLISALQRIHDLAPVEHWEGRLYLAAHMYGLTYNPQ